MKAVRAKSLSQGRFITVPIERTDTVDDVIIAQLTDDSPYRLSCQPAIWNRKYLLQYLKPGLTPWQFESQHPTNDAWRILGPYERGAAIKKIDGIRVENVGKIRIESCGKRISPNDLYDLKAEGLL